MGHAEGQGQTARAGEGRAGTSRGQGSEQTEGPGEIQEGRTASRKAGGGRTRGPRPPPSNRGADAPTGLCARRDLCSPQLSFSVSETGTEAGGGREGRCALEGARIPRPAHLPPGPAGHGGVATAGVWLSARPPRGREQRSGRACPGRAQRPGGAARVSAQRQIPGVLQGIWAAAASRSSAAAHGSARGRGGATSPRCRPGPAPAQGPPCEARPPQAPPRHLELGGSLGSRSLAAGLSWSPHLSNLSGAVYPRPVERTPALEGTLVYRGRR